MRAHVWRLVFPYTGERDRQAPTLDEIQQLVDRRAPEPMVVANPTWLANFRCQRRSSNTYRRGRVLLGGDAVHIHSPAGGQGMNTGIMDAHNLAWKLALVAAGCSSDWLLDTYGEERAPVAAEVLGLTHALVQLGTMRHPLKRALRDTIVPIASRISPLQRRAVRHMSHQHVAYRSSSLTRAEGTSAGLRPGDRAPDIEVLGPEGRLRLYQVLRQTRHVLLVSSADAPTAYEQGDLRRFGEMFEVVVGDFEPQRHVHDSRRGSVFLIRPDGYIAARGTADRMSAILDYLRQLFGADHVQRMPVSILMSSRVV